MDFAKQTIIFIVGLGAPANLYDNYLDDLKKRIPQTKLLVLEWWSQNDFGMSTLQSYINDSDVILIGHSAGSVIALQALEKWPGAIKKIVMLDSHFLRTQNTLPTVSRMLDILLANDDKDTQNKVRNAYRPVIENDTTFIKAFSYAVQWVNERFDIACHLLRTLPAHSVFFIGFTNSSYQIFNDTEQHALTALWNKFGVDVKFFQINHFDLIEDKQASDINHAIVDWMSA